MDIFESIYEKLKNKLDAKEVKIFDESGLHINHDALKNLKEGDISHIKLVVSSKIFEGKSILEQHKMVQSVILDEIKKLHAISIKTIPLSD